MNIHQTLVCGVTAIVTTIMIDNKDLILKKLRRYLKKARKLLLRKQRQNPLLAADLGDGNDIYAFYCPLTHQQMRIPVMTPYGSCFEKKAIEAYIDEHGTCPLTRRPLLKSELQLCYTLKYAIDEYRKLQSNNQ